MRKVVDYKWVSAGISYELTEKVVAMIADGWQPWFGPLEIAGSYRQTMVKYADEETGKSSYDEVN